MWNPPGFTIWTKPGKHKDKTQKVTLIQPVNPYMKKKG
ncbi:hypothetical protein X474_00940 [Dethiosulfatarculus sandiegensis]|uniref:Uncharacterized protein n=1 Tax=Dethiosulfatarculus sandiegensis TaxID=1429043 RepID=A0A0D2JKB3_9BACT|nr:hypothetical protein X474_00940 [Dethiosulfatarculus sandiegensis]